MKSRANKIAAAASALVVLLCVLAVILLHGASQTGAVARIWCDGENVKTVPLARDDTFSVTNESGHTVSFEVKGGKIRFTASDCPDKICVNTGWISLETETAVCMPNRIYITIGED